MTRTWLFGEAEYESNENFHENFVRLFKTAEACGYMIEDKEGEGGTKQIVLDGSDLEHVVIRFLGDKVIGITKRQYTDRTGEMKLFSREEIVVN